MGVRYEKGRKNVSENKKAFETLNEQKSILGQEYEPLQSIEALQQQLDDDVFCAVEGVKQVGQVEGQKIEQGLGAAEKEKEQISNELSGEIAKLNSGLEKLKVANGIQFGVGALEKASSDYKKQIEKFKALKEELLGAASEGGSAAVEGVINANQDTIASLYEPLDQVSNENSAIDAASAPASGSGHATQVEHRPLLSSHEAAVNAVIEDVRNGSGREISAERAEELFSGIHDFSGEEYSIIRNAYNNPNASQGDIDSLNAVDEYIRSAPKWEGEVYRGINVSRRTANDILSNDTVDMLGPSSWSSEMNVAERFSIMGDEPVNMVFILPENRSGASITHLATFNGAESEVTAPSGVQYTIDRYENVRIDNRDYIHVYVHE